MGDLGEPFPGRWRRAHTTVPPTERSLRRPEVLQASYITLQSVISLARMPARR